MKSHALVAAGALMFCVCPVGAGPWNVEILTPAGWCGGEGYGSTGIKQAGSVAACFGGTHAALWSGTSGSIVDLHPGGQLQSSSVRGLDGSTQVGAAGLRAFMWQGSAASAVDLHPAGAETSTALGVRSNEQVGTVVMGGRSKAGLWAGSAASFVELHPVGAVHSAATDTDGSRQVGHANFGSTRKAAMWFGSAGSFSDLHPAGATDSAIWAIRNGVMVGEAKFGAGARAGVWSGSLTAYSSLHPSFASQSIALDTTGEYHAGFARVGFDRAGVWDGASGAWFDLQRFLPAQYYASKAHAIAEEGGRLYVVGQAEREDVNLGVVVEPVVWVSQSLSLCEADCDISTGPGVLDVFDFLCFQNLFVGADAYACNCDTSTGLGVCDVFDFLCFQDAFVAGCP